LFKLRCTHTRGRCAVPEIFFRIREWRAILLNSVIFILDMVSLI